MNADGHRLGLKLLTGVALAGAATLSIGAADAPAEGAAKVNFQDNVLPIFRNACLNCHNADKKRGGLDISSFGATITGSDGRKIVAPGDPESSVLYKVMTHAEEPKMPQRGDKLPAKDLETVRKWIEQGALENAGSKAGALPKPKLALTVEPSEAGKPSGEPAMPKGLSIDPVVKAKRAGAITALAASPWAPVAAVGGQKQVLLYHTQTFELLGVLPFAEGFPQVLKFSRNGALLMAGGGLGAKSGKVVLFDVASGKRIGELGDEFDAVLAADIAADQSRIALGGPGRLVKIHATSDGQLVHSMKKHTDWVTAIGFSPDGKFLATADRAGGLVVWDGQSGHELFVLNGHRAGVTDVCFRGDSRVLASASEDGTVKLWDMEEGKQLKSWNAHGGGAMSVSFAHDGRLVSVGRDKTAKTWGGDGTAQKAMEAMGDIALRTAFDHSGQRVIAGDYSGALAVFNVADGKKVANLDANPPTAAERIALIEKNLLELESASKKAAAEHEQAQQAGAELEAEIVSAQQALAEKQKALGTHQEKVKALDEAVKAARQRVQAAQGELEKAKGPKLQASAGD